MDSPTCPFGAHSMVGGHFVVSCVSAGRAHHTSQPLQPELPSGIHPQVPQTGLLWRGARTADAGVAGGLLDKGLGSAGDGGHARPRAPFPFCTAQVSTLGRGEDSERRIGSAHPARVPKARAAVICGRPPSTWGVLGTSQRYIESQRKHQVDGDQEGVQVPPVPHPAPGSRSGAHPRAVPPVVQRGLAGA